MAAMTAPVPWTVVGHTADESEPAVGLGHLIAWLDERPSVELHTVLWAWGPAGTSRYERGHFMNVGDDHRRLLARGLRSVGLARMGGGVAGRAVRSTLRRAPRSGVLYLSTAAAAPVVRYLPPGERTVITHLHAVDRLADPPLTPDRVARVVEATDVWLAADEETAAWAADEWGLDPTSINVVPEPVDPRHWNRAARPVDPGHLRLGLAGAGWFQTDHTSRVVQSLLKLRPELRLELVWTEAMRSRDHLAPLLHDLDRLGVLDAFELPDSPEEVRDSLDDIDALAVTSPDHEAPWVTEEAAARGVPVACFDTHRAAHNVRDGAGFVVDYLDIVGMATGLLAIHEGERVPEAAEINARRQALYRRSVTTIGTRLLELAGGGGIT